MPSALALMGKGMPAQLAQTVGTDYSALTCTGTTQGGAAQVLSKMVALTAASSQTGAILPISELQEEFNFVTLSSTSAVVYVPSGHYLNGTQNAGLTIAQNKAAKIWQYKPNYWTYILTA